MPNYSILSVWDTDPDQLSWYDHAIGRTKPPTYRQIPDGYSYGNGLQYENIPVTESVLDNDSSWYYELKELDKASDRAHDADNCKASKGNNKPTAHPRGPCDSSDRDDPYFEYMFASADIEDNIPTMTANDDQGHEQFAWKGNQNTFVLTIVPEFEQFVQEQQLIENYLNSVPSSFVSGSHISRSESPELDATIHYGTETGISGSVTSDRFRCTYSDITCGSEECFCETRSDPGCGQEPLPEKPILKPVSPRYTFAKKLLVGLSQKPRHPAPRRHASHDLWSQDTEIVIRKRQADEAAFDNSGISSDTYDGLPNKKARVFENGSDDEAIDRIFRSSHRSASVPSDRAISKDFFKHKPLPSPPRGFVGQFDGMIIDGNMCAVFPFQCHQQGPKVPYFETFGVKAHPNGTFTHTHFRPDPYIAMADYDIPRGHPLTTCMAFATDMTISSCHPNIVALRSSEEEILRREAHIECASARLEGVAVGFWRYLQGSYSLEEYRQANMCICWNSCECNKMCTRYADLKCPCSNDIMVHGDDD